MTISWKSISSKKNWGWHRLLFNVIQLALLLVVQVVVVAFVAARELMIGLHYFVEALLDLYFVVHLVVEKDWMIGLHYFVE